MVAYGFPASSRGSGDGHGNAWNSNYLAFGGNRQSGEIAVSTALSAPHTATGRLDFESDTFLVANAVRASDGHHGHSSPRGDGADNLVAAPLTAGGHPTSNEPGRHHEDDENLVLADPISGVRRLTPLECERLMGWPDDWTRWTADGREISDGTRYRMCGNGVVRPVAEWIGHRLVAVEEMP